MKVNEVINAHLDSIYEHISNNNVELSHNEIAFIKKLISLYPNTNCKIEESVVNELWNIFCGISEQKWNKLKNILENKSTDKSVPQYTKNLINGIISSMETIDNNWDTEIEQKITNSIINKYN